MAAFPRGGLRSWCRGHCRKNRCLLSSFQAPKPRSLVRGSETPGHRAPDSSPNTSGHLCAWQVGGEMQKEDPDCGGRAWSLAVPCQQAAPDSYFASHQPWSSLDPNHSVPKSQLCCVVPHLHPPFHLHNINNKLIITIKCSLTMCQHSKCIPGIESA